jgi:hypothetical protein
MLMIVKNVSKLLRRLAANERGVQLIEVIGYFPLVLLIFVFAWQLLLVGYTGILAANAARDGARAAAVFEDVERAVRNATPGFDGRREWTGLAGYPCSSNNPVTIQVRLEIPHVSFPFIGPLNFYPWVTQHATVRCEPLPIAMRATQSPVGSV